MTNDQCSASCCSIVNGGIPRASRGFFTLFILGATVALLSGCTTPPYTKVETTQRFTHIGEDGLTRTTICRESAGTATVSAKLTNTSNSPITIADHVALYIEGNKAFERRHPTKTHTIQPGKSLELGCAYTFYSSFPRDKEIIRPGQQHVYLQIGNVDTPAIYLDLSADNQVPFRFASHP